MWTEVIRRNYSTDIYTINVGKPPSIKPPTGETPMEKEPGFETITPTPIGFEAIFTITGLLAVAYLLRRRK